MGNDELVVKLTEVHGRCSYCGFERTLYFWYGNYGERIVSTKDGSACAVADLMKDNIVQELAQYCAEILPQRQSDVAPVSYTHLDVYKRQTQGLLECYRNWNGFYEEEGWKIPDLDVAIKELECFDEKMGEPVSPDFAEDIRRVQKDLLVFLEKARQMKKNVFISPL